LQIINGNNLKILGLVASDFGIYQCIGSNPAGNVQAAASLTIYSSGTKMNRFSLPSSHSTVRRPN
jgi:neogenin